MSLANFIKHLSIFCLVSSILVIPRANLIQPTEEEKAKVEGTVLNIDNEPIPKATIQIKHKDSDQVYHAQTNEKGKFSSDFIPPGDYSLTVETQGYISYTTELKLRSNIIQPVEIILAREETSAQKAEKEAFKSFKEGLEFARKNNTDDAIQAFQKAIELKPDLTEAYLNLGVLLFQQQKYDQAEKALLKVLELKPEESKLKQILADINFEQAKALIKESKMDEALEELKHAYRFREDHAYVNYLLGYLFLKKGMKEEAIKHLEAFLKLKPDSPQAKTAKEILEKLKKES